MHYVLYQACETALAKRNAQGDGTRATQYISGNVVEFDRILDGLNKKGRDSAC